MSEAFVRPLPRAATAGEIGARLPRSTLAGDPARIVRGIGALSAVAPDVLAFCDARDTVEALAGVRAAVVIVPANTRAAPRADQTFIAVADVRAAFIETVEALLPGSDRPADPAIGIDPAASIDPGARIAPSACVAGGVKVGARTRIGAGAVVYGDCVIGCDCVIGPGAVVGWVGLAYHDRADGRRIFFPHLAGVRIGDGVDIGAQACICRGMLSHTTIGDHAKIGSLVYVSHGVVVGARAWLSAGTAIAGHARVAADSLLGIGSVVIDNVNVGAGVKVGGGSVVTKHAAAGESLYGVPAHAVAAMRHFGPTPRDRD